VLYKALGHLPMLPAHHPSELITCSATTSLASTLFLKCTGTPGPLHLLFLLPYLHGSLLTAFKSLTKCYIQLYSEIAKAPFFSSFLNYFSP
jgi:hypothetical protein